MNGLRIRIKVKTNQSLAFLIVESIFFCLKKLLQIQFCAMMKSHNPLVSTLESDHAFLRFPQEIYVHSIEKNSIHFFSISTRKIYAPNNRIVGYINQNNFPLNRITLPSHKCNSVDKYNASSIIILFILKKEQCYNSLT